MPNSKLSPALLSLLIVCTVGMSISASAPQAGSPTTSSKLVFFQFAPYYATAPEFQAMIELNNASQTPFSVTPTLYNGKGQGYPLAPIALKGHSRQSFDLRDWVALAGNDFETGFLELEHNGVGPFALGAQINISNPAKHFYLDVPLVFKQMFASAQLQAIWWAPDNGAELKVAVANGSNGPVQAQVTVTATGNSTASRTLDLAAHESQILNLRELLGNQNAQATSGGITIHHNGAPGAIVAEGWVFDPHTRFSGSLPFVDTAMYQAKKLSGAGVMLGSEEQFPGSLFEGHLVLRNASASSPLTANPVLQRGQIKASLGSIKLSAGETKEIAIAPSLLASGPKAAGIEVQNSGALGPLIADWFSVDRYSGMVVETPVRNVSTPRGGNNPWMLDGDFTSVLYVKNTGDTTAEFVSKIWHEQGQYTIGLTEVGAGETAAIDIRKLRDDGVKDWQGHVLPPKITTGQVQWQRNSGPFLIGRVLTASQSLGMASNMSCGTTCCCSPRTATVTLIPSSDTSLVGDHMQQLASETDTACDGTTTTYSLNTSTMTWSTSNAPIASVSTSGYVSCLAPGSATITGTKFVSTVKKTICDGGLGCCECLDTSHNQSGNDNMNVAALSCTSTVARGGSVNCTLTPSTVSASNWKFTDGTNTVVRSTNTTTLSWSGAVVASGTVSVTANQSLPLSAHITVNKRTWHTGAASPVEVANGTFRTLPVPPAPSGNDGGVGASQENTGNSPFSGVSVISDGGPNNGYGYYVTMPSFQTSYSYEINPDLENSGSTFYQHQCGNYSTSNPSGYISGSNLLAQTRRHEYNSSTQSHYAFYSNSMSGSNNPGDYVESRVASPGTSPSSFDSATGSGLNTLYQNIVNAFSVEPFPVNYDANGNPLGNINYAPYASCN